jgi:hypothetical protein
MIADFTSFVLGVMFPLVTYGAYNGYNSYKRFRSDITTLKCLNGFGMYINTLGHVLNFVANMANAEDIKARSAMRGYQHESWYGNLTSTLGSIARSLEQVKKNQKEARAPSPRAQEEEKKHDDGPHLIFTHQED